MLYERLAQADRISALCERASALGLQRGLGLAEARARFPDLDIQPADPAADRKLLAAIADWCDRYTPLVALDAPHGLLLDLSGCAHLFGGETALRDDLLARLSSQGFAASAAIAPQAGTALAVVAGAPGRQLEPGEEAEALAPLSIRTLRLESDLTAMLERLGLKTIGDLAALPRASLTRRFGAELLDRLDAAMGTARRPISPRLAIPALIAERRFAEPISQVEDIQRIILLLADRLAVMLEKRGDGARQLELALFRVDGKVERIAISASAPIRAAARISVLFRERLKGFGDERDIGFGYDLVRLSVLKAEAMTESQADLAPPSAATGDMQGLIDRIGARLGEGAVLGMEAVDSHWPERAMRLAPVIPGGLTAAGKTSPAASRSETRPPKRPETTVISSLFDGLRPVRLLPVPEPVEATFAVPDGVPLNFRWRRALHVVRKFEGPERIAPEWWRGEAERTRDYFRIEDADGRRYWLFRKGFFGEVVDPAIAVPLVAAWYLHGIFA